MNVKSILIIILFVCLCLIIALTRCSYAAIEIKPSPNYLVVLVHGIAETSDIFASDDSGYLKPYLENSLNLAGYVYAYDFDNNKGSNVVAADELGNQFIPRAINDFQSWYANKNHISVNNVPQNAIPQKVVLIAHSMGGLASRVYLTSDYYRDDVKKLITLDTPHLGSDAVIYKKLLYSPENVAMTMATAGIGIGYIILRMQAGQISFADIYFDGAIFAAIYSPGMQLFLKDLVAKWGDPGLNEMDPEGNFIKHLKGAKVLPNKMPIEYRLISAHGFPSPDREGIRNFYLLKAVPLINAIATPFDSRYWELPTTQAKVESVVAAMFVPGSTFVKDGSIVVDIDSAYGKGVSMFNQKTKRYDYLFCDEPLENYLNVEMYQEYQDIRLVHALTGFDPALNLMYLLPAIHIANYWNGDDSIIYNAYAHHHLVQKVYSEGSPNIIDQCLFDTPMATVTHLDTDVSIDAYNMTQKIVHMPGVIQPVEILNTAEASDNPPYAADRSVSLIFNEGTTSEVEKYTSSMLVKVPVTQISGVIHDFKPLMLESFQISENFAAWQEFAPNTRAQKTDDRGFKYIECDVNKFHLKLDEWGRYTISGLNFAEGQNLIAFKLRNRAKYSSNQVCKVIQNTIPMQASKYLPEANYMTNNVYQPIGVEFNKSTYYEDVAGMISITSFEVDGLPQLSAASITSEIDGPYHPYARVNYTPNEPLPDGEHNIVVKAKSDVGVSQAIWSFFVDTQSPMITIKALAPYSPRAPGAQPVSIRYKTSDNLSTFLRDGTIKVYDSKNNFITEIATFDTQAAGENYVQWDGRTAPLYEVERGAASESEGRGEVVPDGNYTIKIKAYDYAGNSTSESVVLTIDSNPPTVLNADVDPKPMTSNSDSMNFSSELSENSIVTIKLINKSTGVASAYIAQATGLQASTSSLETSLDAELRASCSYSWSYNNQFGISGPDDGVYKLEITAQDTAGNVSDPYIIDNVRIDRTPPVIFANACLPYVLANIGDNPYTTTLSYQVSESNDKAENKTAGGQGVGVTVKLFNENTGELVKMWSSALANVGSINEVVWNGNSASIGKGAYKFQIAATDAFGNSSSAYSTCVKDGVAPIISFPANNQIVSGSIAIRGTAIDPDWTNNLPFKCYRIYYAKGNISMPGNLDTLEPAWQAQLIEVPSVNRDARSETGDAKNISIRPLQNDSTLAYLYSNGLENGTYTLLLIAEEDGGVASACRRVIEVKNDEFTAAADVPAVKLNELPARIHFSPDGTTKLPISFVNGIKKSNVNIEVVRGEFASTEVSRVVFHKYQPGVIGNKFTGKPSYTPGQNLGYYIWCDNSSDWHIRWASDNQSHRFTGSLMGSGISNIEPVNWSPSGQTENFVNWDKTLSNGEQGIDFTADSNAMLIITPKIDENPSAPSFYANNIFMGMTNATQSYLPIMISASMEGIAPEVVEWDGKLDTGGFVDSGAYKIVVRSEGADGVGIATDEAMIEVETDYDVSNVETVNKTFSSVGAPDRVSVYFNLSKDSYVSAYVYGMASAEPVCIITTEAFMMGNLNPNRKHVISWKGNYPTPDSALMFTGGSYYMKLMATSADGSDHKEVRIDDIKIRELVIDVNQARLDPIGEEVPYKGALSRVAEGSSPYYWEGVGSGKLYPPKKFSFSLTPYGKQYVTTYPYVPFAMLIHRGYKQIDVKMRGRIAGTIREHFDDNVGGDEQIDDSHFDVGLDEMEWGFRDGQTNEAAQTGPYAKYLRGRSVNSIDEGRNSRAKTNFRYGMDFSLKFYTGRSIVVDGVDQNYFLDRIDNIPVQDQFEITITSSIEQLGSEKEDDYVNTKILEWMKNKPTTYPTEKGMFKVVIDRDDFVVNKYTSPASFSGWLYSPRRRAASVQPPIGKNSTQFWCRARVMPEAPVQYSRLTNRFIPFFGFVNKNHPTSEGFVLADKNIDQLGFPGNEFFNESSAKPYEEFDHMLASAEAMSGLSRKDLMAALKTLEGQKNYSGLIKDPKCTAGFEYYLSDPISGEYGIEGLEYIPITFPEYGTFEVNGLEVNATTIAGMSYKTNPPSLFSFNFPATDDEKQNFINIHARLLDKFKKSPSLWTGIGGNSPHELDPNSVIQTAETKPILGQEIKYDKSLMKYHYRSKAIDEMYGFNTTDYPNVELKTLKFRVADLSDPNISFNLEESGEVGKAAILSGMLLNASGMDWTTNVDPLLSPFGGKITSLNKLFNENAFSDRSGDIYINEPYASTIFNLQNMASPNKLYYTFWKRDPLVPTSEAEVPLDNPHLVYDPWQVTLRDLSGAVNSDLDITNESFDAEPHFNNDRFKVKLKLDSAEKKYVEIKGKAAGDYYLMYFDGRSWNTIKHSDAPAEGTLGWWNVSRLNGKYTVVLKVSDRIIATQDILVGSVVSPDKVCTVSSPYKRAEVSFMAGALPDDQLVTVTPVRMDEIELSGRPSVPTIGPIVELKPSPCTFTASPEDTRPTLTFKYTKNDLREMYPYLDVNSTGEVFGLGLNIHQVTENGGVQIISGNKQSYSEGIYSFEGPLDHFSEYALIEGKYDIMAPSVQTDNYIVNFTPITVYGTAPAESKLYVHVSTAETADVPSIEGTPYYVPSSSTGSSQYKFDKVDMIREGDNYIYVAAKRSDVRTVSHIKVRYDATAPSVEAYADLDSFSPNSDGKMDEVTYRIRSNETGKLYFILKDPKGNTLINQEIVCGANELIRVVWNGEKVYIDQDGKEILLGRTEGFTDGKYDHIVFAVDEAGNISDNIVGFTYIDRVPPVISNISAAPNPFTPSADGSTVISFEVSEPSRTMVNIFKGDSLFFSSAPANSFFAWDGKGERGEIIGGAYTYQIVAEDMAGNIATSESRTIYVNSLATFVNFAYFDPLYFSPFNQKSDKTKLKYNLLKDKLNVLAGIYDPQGVLMKSLFDGSQQSSGDHETVWSGDDEYGRKLESGEYKFILKAVDEVGTSEEISGKVVIDNDPPVIGIASVEVSDDTAKCLYLISEETRITILVVDENGNTVQVLMTGESVSAGEHSVSWLFVDRVADYSLRYSFKISAEDRALNTAERASAPIILPGPVNIANIKADPETFNPNSSTISRKTAISYQLSSKKGNAVVSVKVLSPSGDIVKTLTDAEEKENGSYSVEWNGRNYLGSDAASGNYNVQITASDASGNSVRRSVNVAVASYTSRLISVEPKVLTPLHTFMNFRYEIIDAGDNVTAKVKILTEAGAAVKTLANTGASGTCRDVWDGTDEFGKTVPDGRYRYEISTDDNVGNAVTFASGDIAVLNAQTITISTEPKVLSSNTPNGAITISYKIDYYGGLISGDSNITMYISDHNGTQVYYFSDTKSEGSYSHLWDGTSNAGGKNGGKVPDGLYSLHIDSTDPDGTLYSYDTQLQVYTSLPQISNVTSESYMTANMQDYFNPYTDEQIIMRATGSHVSYPITISSEVWLGNVLIRKLDDAKLFSAGTSEVTWGGTNESGEYVNEGEYIIKLWASDDFGNKSGTYEYTVRIEDDQQLTDISSLGAYSHDPNLTLSGTNSRLKFIAGESWGVSTLESPYVDSTSADCYFGIDTAQNIPCQFRYYINPDSGNTKICEAGYYVYDMEGNQIMHDARRTSGESNGWRYPIQWFLPGRYRIYVYADDAGVSANTVMSKFIVSFIQNTYNLYKTFSLGDLSQLNNNFIASLESNSYEISASNSTGTIHHNVWMQNIGASAEVYYLKNLSGVDGAAIRLTSCEGISQNPFIACDSTANKVYVVWEDYRSYDGNSRGKIFMKASITSGEVWSDILPPIASSGNCMMPAISIKEDGGSGYHIYVAYVDDASGQKELYVKKGTINSAGDVISWAGTARLTRHEFTPLCNAFRPSIVCDTNGDAYVAWEDTRTGTSEIFFQKIPSNFAPFSGSGMTTMSMPIAQPVIQASMIVQSSSITIELISPINGTAVKTLRPTFRWYGIQGWQDYRIECATSSNEASLSGTLDYFTTTISDVSSSKPLCEYIVPEHSMGLDESSASYPYWYWRVKTINTTEASTSEVGSFRIDLPVSLSSVTNWPNPFNPNKEKTKIRYRLGTEADNVAIRIYDITGALVRELDGTCNAEGASIWNKYNDVEWDGRNGRGDMVLNGVYPFEVIVSVGNKTVTGRGKAVVLK